MKRIFRWMVVLTIILWSVQSKSLTVVGTETHMVLDENVIGVQYLYIETYRDHFEISSTGAASCTTIAFSRQCGCCSCLRFTSEGDQWTMDLHRELEQESEWYRSKDYKYSDGWTREVSL